MLTRIPDSIARLVARTGGALALASAPLIAQTHTWTQEAPLPTGSHLYAVQLLSDDEAWAGGGADTVIHTTDGGQHWQSATLPTNSLGALCFSDAQHGWAAGNGFFHTTDGGQSWIQDNAWGTISDLFFLDAQRGWACGNGGVTYRTSDGGLHWSYADVGPIQTLSSIFFVDATHGWTLNIEGQIFVTVDGGQSWTLQWNVAGKYLSTVQFFDAQEGWAIGGDTFLHTLDGGQHWSAAAVPAGTWSHGAHFSDRLHGVSVGEYGNVTRTTDGGQHWTTIQPIGSGSRLWAVHVAASGVGMYCGENGELSATSDGGQTWSSLHSGGAGISHAIDAVDGAHAWAANDGGAVLYTDDGGEQWHSATVAGFDAYGHLQDVDFLDTSLGWAVGRHELFGGGIGRIVRSTDGGRNWQVQLSVTEGYFQAVEAIDAQTVMAFGFVPQGPSLVLRTVNGGQSWTNVAPSNAAIYGADFADATHGWMVGGLIYASVDGGQSWTQQFAPPALMNAVSFADADNGWAVGWFGTILHTSDGGAHWTSQSAGAPVNVLFGVQALSPTTAWISGTAGFVARTSDAGQSWQPETAASTIYPFEALCFLDVDHGWAGGSGIFERDTPSTCPSPAVYCTAKVDSLGCVPSIGWSGTPSVSAGSGFLVTSSSTLNNKPGLFFYGRTGQQAAPFQGGLLCVELPLHRTPLQLSGGNPPPNDCSGAYALDFNAYIASGVDPALVVGTEVDGQYWARDPGYAPPNNTSLTAAIHMTLCP